NWSYWADSDYGHAFCLFDLYSGELKKAQEAKMGKMLIEKKNGSLTETVRAFKQRTIELLCGQINQNVEKTAQGIWFGEGKNINDPDVIKKSAMDLTLTHDNVDPTIGRMVIGGNFTEAGVIFFTPKHSGTINREFSEVKADNKVYCYDNSENLIIFQAIS